MSMSKKDFQGTGKVFSFTLFQTLKNKANIVSLIIMLIIVMASVPFTSFLNSRSSGAGQTDIEQEEYSEEFLASLGVTPEQIAAVNQGFHISVHTAQEYFEESTNDFETRYAIQLVYAVLIMMISVMSVSYIVRTVIEEKASKLVELLMVSVRPLALIVGKILAVMVYVLGMFVLMGISYGVSYLVTGMFMDVSSVGTSFAGLGINFEGLNLNWFVLVGTIVSFMTGYLTFSIIAGLFASGCSSTSEMEGAVLAPTMIIMAGYIVSCAITGFQGGPVVIACSLCPVVSVFCAPVQYLLGNINAWILVAAWVLQALVALILARFCARIYNELIIHRGSKIRLTDMLAMAKENRASGRR